MPGTNCSHPDPLGLQALSYIGSASMSSSEASFDDQRESCHKQLRRYGWQVVEQKMGEERSADCLQQIGEAAEMGWFDTVICWDSERMAREFEQTPMNLAPVCQLHGIKLHFAGDISL